MVLVAVGDEQALDLLLILQHKGEIGDDHVHAQHIVLGEDEAAVHDDHIAAALVDGHILAHLTQAAQRVDVDGHRSLLGLLGPPGAVVVVGPAGAGTLLAAGSGFCCPVLHGSVVLFFCLCHSYLQK